jgi:hypothetical protein
MTEEQQTNISSFILTKPVWHYIHRCSINPFLSSSLTNRFGVPVIEFFEPPGKELHSVQFTNFPNFVLKNISLCFHTTKNERMCTKTIVDTSK